MREPRYIKFYYPVMSMTISCYNRDKYISLVVGDKCPEGYLPQVKSTDIPKGKIPDGLCRFFRYTNRGDHIFKEYLNLPRPTIYSKTKIVVALQDIGKWDALEAWMKSTEVLPGLTAYAGFMDEELSSDHPMFESYLAEAMEVTGLTREQADAILAECVADDE